ncbi:MAG TPA: hypothetical protein VNZ44_14235, partial [Pyrinomonadaceae bacterium]|nr:hypothetical protein [Pyrinomonadaceae bacterium]
MIKRLLFAATLAAALAPAAVAQNTNTSAGRMGTTGRRASTPAKPKATPQPAQETTGAQAEETTHARTAAKRTTPAATESAAVREAFDSLVDGIRRADADAVMAL